MEKSRSTPPGLLRSRAFKRKGRLASQRAAADESLLLACAEGSLPRVEMALAAGARPNAQRKAGRNALSLAVSSCSLEVVERLLKAGASWEGQDALHCASWRASPDIIRALVHAGMDPNGLDEKQQDGHGCHTPLGRASRSLALESIHELFELGALPDAHAPLNASPLASSLDSYGGDPELRLACLLALLRAGCDPNPETFRGRLSPAAMALLHGHPECLRLLLSWWADPEGPCELGRVLKVVFQIKAGKSFSSKRPYEEKTASTRLHFRRHVGSLASRIAQGRPQAKLPALC